MEKEKKGTGLGIVPDGGSRSSATAVGVGDMDGERSASTILASGLLPTHHYYRVAAKSSLGRKLSNYMEVCADAEAQADAFASRYGADVYVVSPDYEAGGVGVLEFKDKNAAKRLSKKGWRIIPMFHEEGFWASPDVKEDTRIVVVGSEDHKRLLEQQKTGCHVLVLDSHLNFQGARMLSSRYELAEMAGVELAELAVSGDDVISPCLPSDKRLTGEERVRLLQERMKPIREAEDRRILCALHDKTFAPVIELEGSDKAVAAYRQMMSLPAVKAGTLNGILGIWNNGVIPSCFSKGSSYYLATYEPLRSPDAKVINSVTHFRARIEAIKASVESKRAGSEESHDR